MKFENIYKETEENLRLALLSLWTPGNHPMRAAIEELFDKEPLLAEPVFQSTFGWEPSSSDSWKKAINSKVFELIEKMREKKAKEEGKTFRPFSPFKHQAESWETLSHNKSIVVTSGTGSGKTECFMYPVVSDLYEQGVNTNAIEAIFLYPLNALMEDQKERLSDFCKATGLRFAVYNGDTPEFHENSNLFPQEIGSRDLIRDDKEQGTRPQILLSNPSMLEYILVRQKDQNMLQQSSGKLRWIVIDEAHSYSGSAAVELAYQIKRILDAFGVEAKNVRFACTSATIGGESGEKSLAEFISNITGQSIDQIKVIGGNRLVETLDKNLLANELREKELPSVERVLSLRNKINEIPGMSLQQIWEWLKPDETFDKSKILPALCMLDQLCEMSQGKTPVLSLRAHFFMRTINGLYACVNENCEDANSSQPIYGHLTTYKASVCPKCGRPLLEVLQCKPCGTFVVTGTEHNQSHQYFANEETYNNEDYFNVDNGGEEDEENVNDNAYDIQNDNQFLSDFYLAPSENESTESLAEDYDKFDFIKEGEYNILKETNGKWIAFNNNGRSYCPKCGQLAKGRHLNFKHFRIPIDFINKTISPTLLQESATNGYPWGKYIAFTDSRQGTAISAKTFNIEVEKIQCYKRLLKAFAEEGDTLSLRDVADAIFDENLFNHFTEDEDDDKVYKSALLRSMIGRRPLYEVNVETLGLATLEYPALAHINFPNRLRDDWHIEFDDAEWRNFLKICLDYFFRLGNHIHPLAKNEKQYVRDNNVSTPIAANRDIRQDTSVQYWPSVRLDENGELANKPSRLVILLCAALGIDSDTELANNARKINAILAEAWNCLIENRILNNVSANRNEGYDNRHFYPNHPYLNCYYLNLSPRSNVCRIKRTEEAWLCPVSRKLIDTIFYGYSPLIKANHLSPQLFERFKCNPHKIKMPVRPNEEDRAINYWIEHDSFILKLKELGLWNNRYKYIYQATPSYIAAEHSAQQSQQTLMRYVNEFKQECPTVNVLHCSTTMEMGVDIGDIEIVLMDTVPPTAANYLQRVGRAGRMGQTKSIAFSLCNNTPVGQHAFENPMWALMTTNHMIKVSPSQTIIQRHINSFFFRQFICENGNGIPANITLNEFMTDFCDNFISFLGNMSTNTAEKEKFHHVFGVNIDFTIGLTIESIKEIKAKYDKVVEDIEKAYIDAGNDENKRTAISNQIRKYKEENLLKYLSNNQFIPNANMPTDVVSFDFIDKDTSKELHDYYEEINDLRAQLDGTDNPNQHLIKEDIIDLQKEIDNIKKENTANRDVRTALNEYAPGQTIVINEKNYISAGISLWGHYNEETQQRAIYHCRNCGYNQYDVVLDSNRTCPKCGEPFRSIIPRQANNTRFTLAFEPIGFRTDGNVKPTRTENTSKTYYNIQPVLLETDWTEHNEINMCEIIKSKENDKILFYNIGNKYGFAFCKRCGRSAIEYSPTLDQRSIPLELRPGHNSLWGGECNANARDIARHVVFTGFHPTCFTVFKFKKNSQDTVYENDEELAYSMGVVLCRALALHEGIDEGEIDFGVKQERDAYVLFIYDTAKSGCGYSLKMMNPAICQEVFDMARVALENSGCQCHADGGACTHCLIDRKSLHYAQYLSKAKALNWLNLQKETAFEIPDIVKQNSPDAKIVFQSLKQIVKQAVSNTEVKAITLCVSDNTDDYTISNWSSVLSEMGKHLNKAISSGKKVNLRIEYHPEYHESLSDKLPFMHLNEKFPDCNVSLIEDMGDLKTAIIIETNKECRRYFTELDNLLSFSNSWGDSSNHVYTDNIEVNFTPQEEPSYKQDPSEIIREGQIKKDLFQVKNYFSGAIATGILKQSDIDLMYTLLHGKHVNIKFSDGYINSALASLLLVYLIDEMKTLFGFSIDNVTLHLQAKNRQCYNDRFNDWTYISFNFPNEDEADKYTENLFEEVLDVKPEFSTVKADHHRWLKIETTDGNLVEIRPDHSISGGFRSNSQYMNLDTLNGHVQVFKCDDDVLFYAIIKKNSK